MNTIWIESNNRKVAAFVKGQGDRLADHPRDADIRLVAKPTQRGELTLLEYCQNKNVVSPKVEEAEICFYLNGRLRFIKIFAAARGYARRHPVAIWFDYSGQALRKEYSDVTVFN